MPQIVQQGNFNQAALNVDDLYVVIKPPGPKLIRGVPTDIAGIVGTASWGPVASGGGASPPILIGSQQEVLHKLGPVTNGAFDIPTAIAVAGIAGASNFRCIRVVDGTEAAATLDITDDAAGVLVTLTAKYTGTLGNSLRVFLENGSQASTAKLSIFLNGSTRPKEIYDNLPITAVAFKAAIVDALANGQNALRPPSEFCTAAADGGTGSLDLTVTQPLSFASGVDGNASVDETDLIGSATAITGMYALADLGVSQFILFGHNDPDAVGALWSTAVNFAIANGMLAILGFPTLRATADCIADKESAGIDTFAAMLMKDHILWDDPVSNRRLIPPEALALGMVSILSPEQGVGNKPVYGIAGTERTRDQLPYTNAEVALLTTAGINFITNPIPWGHVYGLRHSQNASSDGTINGVNYTRMTNFLAASMAESLGRFVGLLQSSRPNDQTRADAKGTLAAFLVKLKALPQQGGVGMIDDFSLVCDETNNPPQSVAEGFLRADVAVRYLAVIRFFIINLTAGQTVVTISATPPGTGITSV